MPMSVFVSHVYEDRAARTQLERWADAGRLGPGVVITGESVDSRQEGTRAIRRHLSPLLTGAGVVLVLVGADTHSSHWVGYEVQHAMSQRKAVLAVRVPGTTGAPPAPLQGGRVVELEARAVRDALQSVGRS